MTAKRVFALLYFITALPVFAQTDVPQDYFQDPLQIPLILSGTFGELRSNHFHSGLDIKTQQQEGLPIQASASGYVSRINISHYGYGKALYIQHPNGYTTVYAHLQKFSPEIEAYVKKAQYEKERYEIELFPSAGTLQVDQGELIAFSGNTGGSGGPHLHFEIRDGQQRPMNPMLFGIEVPDSRPPLIQGLFVYPVGEEAHVNGSGKRQRLSLIPQADGSYQTPEIKACGDIGFGVVTVDQLNGAPNRNGVYQIQASVNGNTLFDANFQRFSFSETRHLNQLIDYGYYTQNRQRITKLFVPPSNPLSIYSGLSNRGFLNVQDSLEYEYTIRVLDYAGNQRMVRVPIQGQLLNEFTPEEDPTTPYFVKAGETAHFQEGGISVTIPENSLYQDAYLDMEFEEKAVKVHEDVLPLHTNIRIAFDVSQLAPAERENLFVARLNQWGNPQYSTTYREGDQLITRTRTFGKYTLASDVNPPRVRPINFQDGQWISANKDLKVTISDDLSGIREYRATVNGKFILMEYEYKLNRLTHDFSDGVVTDTENLFRLEVTDNVGNTTVYEATFYRKQP